MKEPIKYSENHFRAGTKVCSKETGSIGIVQANFGDIDRFVNDLSDLVPVKWEEEDKISAVLAVYLTDTFTEEF